ncbi:GyrI-like domain-containing protein [Actinomadura macrotermitis]|uniref:AraC effector-binding domain-containing protein n=1 Tax=Actinomadura macrotermitis TaxID=2585200 RepID=A0A7K0C3P3_9ACTN|nr:GyrI-like domain-containing protein [Actinomadura macrotermitis]MQY08070.1 hypothetical protein [Actinomadura macrotermitis]
MEIQERPVRHYAGVRRTVTAEAFADIADRIPVILGWLAERGVAPADAPFLKYETIDMPDAFEVVAGVPVAAPVEGDGEVFAASLPAGRYAVHRHHGHPDGLVAATAELIEEGLGEGLAWDMDQDGDGQHWAARLEIFRSHPLEVPDPADWVTDVEIRLA